MKFGYVILSAVVLSSLACQDARLIPTRPLKKTAQNDKAAPAVTEVSAEEMIKGDWLLVAVDEKGQLKTADEEGFVRGQKTLLTFDGTNAKFMISNREMQNNQHVHLYQLKGNELTLKNGDLPDMILKIAVNGESLDLAYPNQEVEKYKKSSGSLSGSKRAISEDLEDGEAPSDR